MSLPCALLVTEASGQGVGASLSQIDVRDMSQRTNFSGFFADEHSTLNTVV
jgi:hypothetical protein